MIHSLRNFVSSPWKTCQLNLLPFSVIPSKSPPHYVPLPPPPMLSEHRWQCRPDSYRSQWDCHSGRWDMARAHWKWEICLLWGRYGLQHIGCLSHGSTLLPAAIYPAPSLCPSPSLWLRVLSSSLQWKTPLNSVVDWWELRARDNATEDERNTRAK